MRLIPVVIAQENAFVIETERDGVPLERKLFQDLRALDHR
jgi:hypothetical protein